MVRLLGDEVVERQPPLALAKLARAVLHLLLRVIHRCRDGDDLRRGRALQLGPLAEAHDEHPGQRRGHLLRHVSGETTRRAAESGRTARRRKQWACFATASAGRIHEQAEATHQDVSGETRATERLQSEMDMAGGHTSDGNLREEKERSAACLIKYGRSRATSQGRPFGRAPRAARLSRARVRGASGLARTSTVASCHSPSS